MKKKIFAFFAIVLAVTCFVFPSFAERGETVTTAESAIVPEQIAETEAFFLRCTVGAGLNYLWYIGETEQN